MSDFKEKPIDPRTPFDGEGKVHWLDWFLKLWLFLQGVCKTKQDVEALDIDVTGGTP